MTGVAWWSQVANSNATQDPSINWQEGQAPSSINDSARAMMASTAKWRDDIAGAIVTTGTSTSYAVSSYEQFDTLVRLNNQVIAFTPHTTSGATVTLNVDTLGNKPLRSAPNVELPAGTLIQGTPYEAVYNNTDGAFYLKGFYGSPYLIPLGGFLDYAGGTAPSSAFAFPYGQAISRTTYASLFSLIGTTFGAGDGSTTFNLPDLRGRVSACPDQLPGSTDAGRLVNGNMSGRLGVGGSGGEAAHQLTVAELAAHTHSNTLTDPGHTHNYTVVSGTEQKPASGGNPAFISTALTPTTSSTTGITINNASQGSGVAHNTLQPTLLLNKIMRII
ncbi:phage tail protein [Bradyrhizobium sp. STM 3557]|uniref:phage tail protein n=1 Tax=Bradyrhizobium sp. STM 3557 TaxID=578920 RepID=UPI0038908963